MWYKTYITNMEQEAISLKFSSGTILIVSFENGLTKSFDMKHLYDRFPQYKLLEDRDLFKKGKLLGWSIIYWNDDLDIDAETIYDLGETISSPSNIEEMVLGYKFKKERLSKEMNQAELSLRTKISQADISRIEKGLSNPSIDTIKRLAKGLGVKISISLDK